MGAAAGPGLLPQLHQLLFHRRAGGPPLRPAHFLRLPGAGQGLQQRAGHLFKQLLTGRLLSCSALWLAAQTPLAAPMWGLLREEGPQVQPGQSQGPAPPDWRDRALSTR